MGESLDFDENNFKLETNFLANFVNQLTCKCSTRPDTDIKAFHK